MTRNLAAFAADNATEELFDLAARYSPTAKNFLAVVGIKRDAVGSSRTKFDFFCLDDFDNALVFANSLLALEYDVYYQPTLLKSMPRRGRGKKENIAGSSILWIDRDLKPNENREKVLEKILNFKLVPSVVVSTGNGFHCYWALDEFVEDIYEIESRNKWLQLELDGDNCWDAAHILRVPGTKNFKNRQEPKEVTIVYP